MRPVPRLDEVLVTRQLSPSRSRARDQINRGCVAVNGTPARKPAQTVSETDRIELVDAAERYVSRAALKLIHALDHFKLSPQDKFCLDIGASTGGFTQVLLERGAKSVVALDVGHGQLAPPIAADSRVISIEGQNARDLTGIDLEGIIDFVTADVSFISLRLALPSAMALALANTYLVALIKPQFEVGKDRLPKDGVVKDPALQQDICTDISRFIEGEGWSILGIVASPIEGGDGNREFLVAARKP